MSLTTFSQVAARWKAEKRQWVKPSTYAVYVQVLNSRLLPFFGPLGDGHLDEERIQAFVNGQLHRGLSPGTVRETLMILRMILRFGAKTGAWRQIEYEVHFPASDGMKKVAPVLDRSAQRRLSSHLKANFSFRNLGILISLHSGLRIGEICALQWQDLDVEKGVIRVNKTVQRIWLSDGDEKANTLTVGAAKTACSMREIPIPRELMKILRPLRKLMAGEHFVLTNTCKPLEPRYYRDYFRRLLQSLGIEASRFHILRHSFATRCIESNCDYKAVSAILGHASITTTMNLYVHPGYEEKRKAIEKMARSLY